MYSQQIFNIRNKLHTRICKHLRMIDAYTRNLELTHTTVKSHTVQPACSGSTKYVANNVFVVAPLYAINWKNHCNTVCNFFCFKKFRIFIEEIENYVNESKQHNFNNRGSICAFGRIPKMCIKHSQLRANQVLCT